MEEAKPQQSGYAFQHTWQQERARLAALEAHCDPWSIANLETLDIQPGWRCLEVGAGGGSIAAWLCERVGPRGQVVATELETTFLETISAPNLEVRRHDITCDPLEEAAFDLVHVRAVLAHLPARAAVLRRLVVALKPHGWLGWQWSREIGLLWLRYRSPIVSFLPE
jgi:2-polyprenyl-3-methyl-5-hydroxy-6-metoxy-1,4-benzoquinol methylase